MDLAAFAALPVLFTILWRRSHRHEAASRLPVWVVVLLVLVYVPGVALLALL